MIQSTTVAVLIVLIFAVIAAAFAKLFHEKQRGVFSFGKLTFPFGKSAQWFVCFAAMVAAFYIIRLHELPAHPTSLPPGLQPGQTPGHASDKTSTKAKKAARRKRKPNATCRIP